MRQWKTSTSSFNIVVIGAMRYRLNYCSIPKIIINLVELRIIVIDSRGPKEESVKWEENVCIEMMNDIQ